MPAYVFTGDDNSPYPWGTVRRGDVAYFELRAPNGDWSEVGVPVPDPEPASGGDMPARPNKAASADDWRGYATVDGSFQAATGKHPDDATRKEIVDHYTQELPMNAGLDEEGQ